MLHRCHYSNSKREYNIPKLKKINIRMNRVNRDKNEESNTPPTLGRAKTGASQATTTRFFLSLLICVLLAPFLHAASTCFAPIEWTCDTQRNKVLNITPFASAATISTYCGSFHLDEPKVEEKIFVYFRYENLCQFIREIWRKPVFRKHPGILQFCVGKCLLKYISKIIELYFI